MINALTIDLEDWFCVSNLSHVIKKDSWNNCELRIVDNTMLILELLNKYNIKATFFVLGWIAERLPELVQQIDSLGHELATHGYSHSKLTDMNPESFEEDLCKAIEITKSISKKEILGFRAPSFTITQKTLWAIDILTKYGIKYDSSVFPINFHPDYGLPEAPLDIYKHNDSLIEVPLSCVEIFGRRIPCSGGGYFRIFPYPITRFLIKRCNAQGRHLIFYLHPWELDPNQPRINLPLTKRIRHYRNLDKTKSRFERLLNEFEFTTIKGILGL